MVRRQQYMSRRLLGFLFTLSLVWFAWDTPVAYPLRTLTTFLHEMGHAAIAVITGGEVESIVVRKNGSGTCMTRGGWRWAVLMGGYLGSMGFGSLILILSLRTKKDKFVTFALGAILGLISLIFVPWGSFGFWSGLAIAGVLASSGWWLSSDFNQLVLTFIGTATCLQAVFDIRDLFHIGKSQTTDAAMFAREILPLPPQVWALFWGGLAVGWLFFSLRYALTNRRNFFRS
jgi:hypothetical protein